MYPLEISNFLESIKKNQIAEKEEEIYGISFWNVNFYTKEREREKKGKFSLGEKKKRLNVFDEGSLGCGRTNYISVIYPRVL